MNFQSLICALFFQDDVHYLYQAMEALIASNQSNPLQQPQDKSDTGNSGGAATATTSVADAPLNSRGSSSGQSSLVNIPNYLYFDHGHKKILLCFMYFFKDL